MIRQFRFYHGTGIRSALAFAVIALAVVGQKANAEVKIYMIKPELSSITISGQIVDTQIVIPIDVEAQGVNSLTTSYGGTIRADRGAGTIQFLGGSLINANLLLDGNQMPSNWQPAVGGGAGSAPAVYAGQILGGAGVFAGRDFIGDLIDGGVLNITGGDFDLSGVNLLFTGGTIDYNVGVIAVGSEGIDGNSVSLSGIGSISGVGPTEMITIPINGLLSVPLVDGDGEDQGIAQLQLTGQLVAVVPEPSAIWLSIVATTGLLGLVWRRRRHR